MLTCAKGLQAARSPGTLTGKSLSLVMLAVEGPQGGVAAGEVGGATGFWENAALLRLLRRLDCNTVNG